MRRVSILLTLVVLVFGVVPAWTQDGASQEAPDLGELHQLLQQQQELLAQQDRELRQQRQHLDEQSSRIEEQRRMLESMQARLNLLDPTPSSTDTLAEAEPAPETGETPDAPVKPTAHTAEPASIEAMEADVQQMEEAIAAQEPEAPADVLRSGEFPGSIHLPGTDLNARVGGFVRLGSVNSLDPIGSDDRFIVGSIPPEGEATAADEPRSTISAKRSRVNMDVRMDSKVGQFRAFVEGDFAGDGGTENYRLRHAYGQYNKLLLGQTWSTFMDISAIPEDIDFEGLSAQINVRHPLMRWAGFNVIGRNWRFALEDPDPSFTGGSGVGDFADVVTSTEWRRKRRHMQLGVLVRSLTGRRTLEDGTEGPEDSIYAYGLNLSGSILMGRRNDTDNLKFQLNAGRGIGNYVNDLRSVGGQDGVFNPETGKLESLPVFAGYVAYQRWWRPLKSSFFRNLRSTLVYSYVYVDNFTFQEDTAYRATQRATANVILSPIQQLDLGLELLYGSRLNKDSSRGDAVQWQLVATFRF